MSDRTTQLAGEVPSGLPAGIVIAIGSLLSVFAMSHHPSIGAGDTTEVIAELTREAGIAGVVHGAMIVMVAALVFGFWVFSERLGLRFATVRAGLVAYVLGAVAMIGAATISGFVVPGIGMQYAGGSAAEMETALQLMAFGHVANQALAQLGVIAMSVAILSWSSMLVGRVGVNRAIGLLGLVVGLVPAAALLGGHLRLDVHGMGMVIVSQTVWNLAVATQLIRRQI